jgi:peptidoglycan/xylan/chitin deacetylase (PgdA/CDA1 family)
MLLYDLMLSFDDGPSSGNTERVLSALSKYGIKATFFVLGSTVKQNPDVLLKIHKARHEIGIHTWSHSDLTLLSNEQILAELLWTAKAIKEVIGVTPSVLRPPCKSFCIK